MTISTDPGEKGEDDKIIKWNKVPLTMRDLAKILLLYWENEDRLHPPPQRGGRMLLDFINELFDTREITPDLEKRYYL